MNRSEPGIVFVGAERVGRATLKRLLRTDQHIAGVVTAHEALREDIADWAPFDDLLVDRDIPYYKVYDSNSKSFVGIIESMDPDVIFVISWSFFISPEVIHYPQQGVVGLHYSLLPKRRGGAPLNWALIDGLTETGITLFYMGEELDTGDIMAQRRFEVDREDNIRDLLDRIVDIAPDLVAEYADSIARGTAPRREQDDAEATYTEARSPDDSRIDWDQSQEDLYNFIRALAEPYPPAFTPVGDHRLVIPAATFEDGRLEIEGYFEQSKKTQPNGGTSVNATASLSDPAAFVSEIRTAPTDEPVELIVGPRRIHLTDAELDGETVYVSVTVR